MLCEERGFILEIADLIRGMGLTILKGVMEARNDKIWARFAVEVIISRISSLLYLNMHGWNMYCLFALVDVCICQKTLR